MTEYTVSLPESIYRRLLSVAQAKGISPINWIAAQLPSDEAPQPSSEFPADLIGAIDSSAEPTHVSEKTDFGEILEAKFAKQGIRFP